MKHGYAHPKYNQSNKKINLQFLSHISIIDLLFNYNKDAEDIVKLYKIKFS